MKRTSKYVGLDVHLENTVISVRDDSTRVIARAIVATEAGALVGFCQQLRGSVHVALEEGTQAQWLYDVLRPVVDRVVVCDLRGERRRGNKGDQQDADTLAARLQRGDVRVVYHDVGARSTLREVARAYATAMKECTSQMLRLKAIFRARGIPTAGSAVYDPAQRKQWLAQLAQPGARFRTELLYELLDTAAPLRLKAKARLIAEARRDPSYKRLRKIPGFGPIRAALVLALLLSPWRFRTKRNLWAFAGLAVVTHTSAEYTTHQGRPVRRARAPMTRGLNRNHHPLVKYLFKSAALAAIRYSEPVRALYTAYLTAGVRPEIARVTIARKLAASVLHVWKTGDAFDATKLTSLAT
jgi:transposase